jgi:protein O-mannosyl-transferase
MAESRGPSDRKRRITPVSSHRATWRHSENRESDSSGSAPERDGPSVWLRAALPLLVAFSTFIAFLPALQCEFLSWDDDRMLFANDHFRGLGGPQLHWMFTAYWSGHYHPLTWLSFAVDYRLWGLGTRGAFGFHLTNVVLHALNAGLFFFVAKRLLVLTMPARGDRPPAAVLVAAAFAALLFGAHPLRVESVAWITERRDVLSVFFLLPCLLCYLRYATTAEGRWRWYAAALLLLSLSLLSKAWGMTLPAVLVVLDFYPLRRLGRRASSSPAQTVRVLAEKLPFGALAGWAAYHAYHAQFAAFQTMKTLDEYGWLPRIAQAFYGVAFYLWRTLWPVGLVPIYEIPFTMNPFAFRFIASAIAVVLLTGVVLGLCRRWPAAAALWACYVITVSPVLGLTQSGPQLAADRYSYVSCMTWALLGAAGLLRVLRARTPGGRRRFPVAPVFSSAGAVVVVLLGVLTWRQAQVWRSSRSLWEHTLAIYPDSYNAHNNLAVLLHGEGDYAAAEQHYRAALAVNPNGFDALSNLGGLFVERGQYAEALRCFERGLQLCPVHPGLQMNIAATYQYLGRFEEAIAIYRRRLSQDPPTIERAEVVGNLGTALASLGRMPEALDYYRQAVALAPQNEMHQYNVGLALRRLGDRSGALSAFDAVVRLAHDTVLRNPNAPARQRYLDASVYAGELSAETGDTAGARRYFEAALAVDPHEPRASQGLHPSTPQRGTDTP